MAYVALTAAQLSSIRKELAAIVDPTIQGALIRIFDVLANDDDAEIGTLQTDVTSAQTSITNLNAWATALATKLNADAGVTDTNYDTTPQS